MARQLNEDFDETSLMTPEEIAAMQAEGAEDLDETEGDEAPLVDVEDDTEGDAPPPAAAVAAPAAPAAAPEPVEEAPAFKPSFTDADKAQLETINAKRAEIAQQADDGELSFKEMQDKLKEADAEAATLVRKQLRDEERAALYEQQNQAAWDGLVGDFLAGAKVDPKTISDDQWDALDAISQSLTGSAALVKGMTKAAQVQEVFRIYDAQNPGKWLGEKPWEANEKKPKAEPKADDPKAKNEVQVPPTLGSLPSSDAGPGVEDGRFSALDRLADTNPMRFERELAKLPEDVREAYLAV